MLFVVVWVAVAVLFSAEWYAVSTRRDEFETLTKPVATLTVLAPAVAHDLLSQRWGWIVTLGLLFGAIGDVLLLDASAGRFVAGLTAFLGGHVFYFVAFTLIGFHVGGWMVVAAVVVGACLVVGRRILPAVWAGHGATAAIPVGAYMLLLGAMVVAAGLTGSWLITVGASLFIAGDTILAVNRFVRPLERSRLPVMVTYLLGQLGIVVGAAIVR